MATARNIAAYLPVNLATALVAFGGIAILTRILGAEEYGRYALAMVTMLFVHMSLFTWLEASIARFQARAERHRDEPTFLRTIYVSAAVLGLAGMALLVGVTLALPLSPEMTTVLLAALVTTVMQLGLNLGFEAHKASHRIRRYSAIYSTHQLLSFAFGIGIILFTPLREAGYFVGIGLSVLIIGAIDIPFMLRKLRGGAVETQRIKGYFTYGAPISLSLVLSYALNSGDLYIITALMGEAQAGTYSAGYNLSNRGIDILFVWIGMAMTPLAVTAFEQHGEARSVEVMRDYGGVLIWMTLPAAVGLALVAEPLGFILGEGVRDGAVKVIPWIAFAGVLNGLISYYVQRAFMLSGKTGMFAWLLIVPVVLNVGLNLILIPIYGLLGAVLATLGAYGFCLVTAFIAARKIYPLPLPLAALAQVSLACAVMAAAVIALPPSIDALPDAIELAIKSGLGAVVYLTVCIAMDTAGCRGFAATLLSRFRKAEPLEVAQ